ncbi:MAG: methyltransferase domain-containing protein [Candidatus Omnitrophota bacterium]
MEDFKIHDKRDKPWFVKWFDENYLIVYRHRNAKEAKQHTQLIIDTLHPPHTSTILDLACGEGRYTLLFKEMGYRIMGLDLSQTLIRHAKEKDPHLDVVIGDMRFIPGHFDLILSLFTSFGYFEDDGENEAVIRAVFESLNPGGIFWLDFFNTAYVARHLIPESRLSLSPSLELIENRRIQDGRIIKDISFVKYGQARGETSYRESVRLYSLRDLEALFTQAGFRIIHCFGDYHGNPWTADAMRTIMVGQKDT